MSFQSWWAGLAPERQAAFTRRLSEAVLADGLTVFKAAEDRFVPIPIVLTPEPIEQRALELLGADARLLLSATIKLARWLYGPDAAAAPLHARLFGAFTPLEEACLRADPARMAKVATARVDYFLDPAGTARALELNATIPAMQGYSDILLGRWLEAVCAELGRPPLAPHRNTDDLLASLLEHYRRAGGTRERPSILVVSRRGDSQLGELLHYVRAFGVAGHRALHCWADEVDLDDQGRQGARGERFDLLYRHIFARRVEDGCALARLLRDPGPNILFNPVVSPLEVKGMLGLLHEALDEPARAARWGLVPEELDAVRRAVPWTRLLTAENAAWAAAHGDRLVLKKSWDYGGKSVLLGPDVPDWPARVAKAAAGPDAWVLQEYVTPRAVRHLLVHEGVPTWREMFVDISAYANHGAGDVVPRGGVCRASGSKIVNILGGGGLTPLVPTEILTELFGA